MSTLASHHVREVVQPFGRDSTILPTLFGESQGLYRIQRSTFFLSFLLLPCRRRGERPAAYLRP